MRRTAIVSLLTLCALAQPCITLPGKGYAPVAVASETAVIVWDPATKTEHFIRSATFQSDGKPMGFLVPTPTPPKLSAVGEYDTPVEWGYRELERQIAPKVVKRKRPVYRLTEEWEFFPPGRFAAKSAPQTAMARSLYMGDSVDVFSEGQVGDYRTAVLRADDSQALLAWLKKNGFEADARLTEWLDPYVSKGWAITAFRFSPISPSFTSAPIRLSFKTDRPFYPYREPKEAKAALSRSLRVYFVSPERVNGQLETEAWPTHAESSSVFASRSVTYVADAFGLPEALFRNQRLTSFLDKTSSRPLSELYFDRDPNQREFGPPPIVQVVDEPIYIPKASAASLFGFGILGAVFIGRRRRR